MIFLLHQNATRFIRALNADEEIKVSSNTCAAVFWELATGYPEELIVWCEEKLYHSVDQEEVLKVFQHDLIMASCPVNTQYIPDTIGYVDQLPFVNPDYSVKYPSWRMSTDLGGIRGRTAIKFMPLLRHLSDFGYLLNSMAKIGQQNSLFCYSIPGLINKPNVKDFDFNASTRDLFRFVAQHYKKEWLWVLLFCFYRYEKKLPIYSFVKSLNLRSFFKSSVELQINFIKADNNKSSPVSIDVIIPTLHRAEHVKNLLQDLKGQSKLPDRVIIVEQDPDFKAESKLYFLKDKWPFEIIHHFVHRTGACYARNLAMESVKSELIFFADDDIRLEKNLLDKTLREISRLGVDSLNLNCLQPREEPIFHKIKQWGAFGSGTSVVRSDFALECKFSEFLEKGFGEDIDYGLQLRSKGCDIIYHPDLQIMHLKADRGGFRDIITEKKNQQEEAKPSPTMMHLVKSSYNQIMQRGYKVSLFLKFYSKQDTKNPFRYFGMMHRKWKISEDLCAGLQKREETP